MDKAEQKLPTERSARESPAGTTERSATEPPAGTNLRRVVTGHDADGRSVVLIDGPCIFHRNIGGRGWNVQDIWESDAVPEKPDDG